MNFQRNSMTVKTVRLKRFFATIVLAACFTGIRAQSFDESIEKLSSLMEDAAQTNDYAQKHSFMESFADLLAKTLKTPKSLYQPFDGIPYMKVLASKDGMMRVFSWGEPDTTNRYKYHAIVQRRMGGKDSPLSDIYVLEDVGKTLNNPENQILHFPDWFGCLYYEMVEKRDGDKTVYTLMGFDYNDRVSYKKYIDVLTFNAQGVPSFGAPVFVEEKGRARCRVILEYWAQSMLHLSYHADIDKLVFNLLHPIVPERKNDKSSYIPDLSYDGFEFKYGKWMIVRHVLLKKKF